MNIQKLLFITLSLFSLITGSTAQAKHRHRRHHHTHFGVAFNVGRPVIVAPRYPVYCYRPVLVHPRPVVCYQPRVSLRMGFGSFGFCF